MRARRESTGRARVRGTGIGSITPYTHEDVKPPRAKTTESTRPRIRMKAGDALKHRSDILCVFQAPELSPVIDLLLFHEAVEPGRMAQVPRGGRCRIVESLKRTGPSKFLFVESSAQTVRWSDIERFGRNCIRSIVATRQRPRKISMSIHGPFYGLDEERSVLALLCGLRAGVAKYRRSIRSLEEITIVGIEPDQITYRSALWKALAITKDFPPPHSQN